MALAKNIYENLAWHLQTFTRNVTQAQDKHRLVTYCHWELLKLKLGNG